MVTYSQQLEDSIDVLHSHCIFQQGKCETCECRYFCACDKPKDFGVQDVKEIEIVTEEETSLY